MRTINNKTGTKILQSFHSWRTDNEYETVIEFDPMLRAINNCLHIRSMHVGANGKRKRSYFIHVLTLGDIVALRDFLNEVLANAEHKLQIKPRTKV
jgi:hypothetical protein